MLIYIYIYENFNFNKWSHKEKGRKRMENNLLTTCYVPDIHMHYPSNLHNSVVNGWGQWYLLTQPYGTSAYNLMGTPHTWTFIPSSEFQMYSWLSNSLSVERKYYRMPFKIPCYKLGMLIINIKVKSHIALFEIA